MPDLLTWTCLFLAAFLTSILSGVAGFGGAMIFLPILVAVYGARPAVPILTVAVLLGNASRVYFNRRELNLKLVALFSLGSIPFAMLGSLVYVALPALWIKKAIGLFLLSSVAAQKLYKPLRIGDSRIFVPLGAVSGFLSAIIGGIGPFSSPFFLAYGLTKEAFVGTEALCAVGMHLAKSVSYHRLNVLGWQELLPGLGFGVVMSLGSYAAKKILERLSRERFLLIVETLLVLIGALMLIA
ncbi:MAG: hypothetical protein A3J74_07160 [Elusimicrobia bacterium RIFCSPHIGHO2_02_FULL_57_9]|nr:MAG: hypothetical protein A3J74_07160 [Elusimicrobia bacterium RIFCSPHIGHO2_02_FULL_57_9]